MNKATDEDYLREESVQDMNDNVVPITKYEPSTGCWIDDRWGQYGVTRLIEIAEEYGFRTDDTDDFAIYAYKNSIDSFILEGDVVYPVDWILGQGGLGDIAEDWLNEHVAKPGFSFGWQDGEFFLMNNEWWEEDEYEETTDIDRKNP